MTKVPDGAIFTMPGAGGLRDGAIAVTKTDIQLYVTCLERLSKRVEELEGLEARAKTLYRAIAVQPGVKFDRELCYKIVGEILGTKESQP